MKKIALGLLLGIIITGCNHSLDGKYVAMTKSGFMNPSTPIFFEVKESRGQLNIYGKNIEGKVEIKDDTLFFDGISFHSINKGESLKCYQCEQMGLPSIWEKL